jgi:hypothetical protein
VLSFFLFLVAANHTNKKSTTLQHFSFLFLFFLRSTTCGAPPSAATWRGLPKPQSRRSTA